MTKFEHRARFEGPDQNKTSIIAREYNNLPITTEDLEKDYYHIETEDVYVDKERFQKYIVMMLLQKEPIADYIMEILIDEMTEDGELKTVTVSDIMERLI